MRDKTKSKRQEITCLHCGENKKVYVKKDHLAPKFCGRPCYSLATAKKECVCKNCGMVYLPKETGRDQFCGNKCKWVFNGAQRRKQTICKKCGAEFNWWETEKRSKEFCSELCEKTWPEKICVGCGKKFVGHQNTKWCSEKCFYELKKDRYLENQRDKYRQSRGLEIKEKICEECGQLFTPENLYQIRFCSNKCGEKNAKQNRNQLIRYRSYGRVYPDKIWLRDGGICQICKTKVDRTKKAPHPKSVSLDHIVPISKGGTHEMSNLRLAHFLCNSKRGNRGEAQLLLFAS